MITSFFPRCEDLGGRLGDSFPACAFSFLSGDRLVHTYSTLYAKIGPQWLSKLRKLAEFPNELRVSSFP